MFDYEIKEEDSETLILLNPKLLDSFSLEISIASNYPLKEPQMKLIVHKTNLNSVYKTNKFFPVSDFMKSGWKPSDRLVDIISM